MRRLEQKYIRSKQSRFPSLFSYQRSMCMFLRKMIEENNLNNAVVLNAGSGLDLISLTLKRDFSNLKITLADISIEILSLNREIFEPKGVTADLIRADVSYLPFKRSSFDIVFNTGLLEHFGKDKQKRIFNEILRVTARKGYFITANPSQAGRIYKFGMDYARKKGLWQFGREEPIKTLRYLKTSETDLEEYNMDFTSQLDFLGYVNPAFRIVFAPFKVLSRVNIISRTFDLIFGKIFGTYLLISVFRNWQDMNTHIVRCTQLRLLDNQGKPTKNSTISLHGPEVSRRPELQRSVPTGSNTLVSASIKLGVAAIRNTHP